MNHLARIFLLAIFLICISSNALAGGFFEDLIPDNPVTDWMKAHPTIVDVVSWFSGISLAIGLVVMPILIVKIPYDYFYKLRPSERWWYTRDPRRWTCGIIKNTFCFLLLIFGLASMPLPGQGTAITILAIVLSDMPGKRKLILKIMRWRWVLTPINALRRKWKKDPLDIPEKPPRREDM